jgi:putative ABC transport system substrate-binding protein
MNAAESTLCKVCGCAFAAWLFALWSFAEAQQAKKIPRIGYLSASSASEALPRTEAFRRGLRDLGYVEGN